MQVKSNEPDIHELDFTVLAAAATAQEGAHIQEAILRSKIDSAPLQASKQQLLEMQATK